MSKLESEFSKWFRNIYQEHDKVIAKGDEWMAAKDKELFDLEQKAQNFELEMEKQALQIEKVLKTRKPKNPKWLTID